MSKRVRKRSQLQEKRAAKDVGGRTVAGSGAAKFSGGGDVRKQGELRIECKFTKKDYYDLKLADLKKIQLQALKGGLERAVIQLEFITPSTSLKYAIVPDLPNDALRQLKFTPNRQAKLHRDELMKLLLEHPDGIQLTFLDGVRKVPHTVTITHWSSFLRALEEEDEC